MFLIKIFFNEPVFPIKLRDSLDQKDVRNHRGTDTTMLLHKNTGLRGTSMQKWRSLFSHLFGKGNFRNFFWSFINEIF